VTRMQELMERAKDGDEDAFSSLLEPLLVAAFRLAVVMLGDRSEAQDAVQEAATTAWRKLGNVREGAPLDPWFLAITANSCRRRRRLWWRRRSWSLETVPDTDTGPDHAQGTADALAMQQALRSLSDDQRLVVVLRYYFDLPLAEVAAITRVPVGTVKSRLHRAIEHLRTEVATQEVAQ
jgi:RNA polymerase sigma factor (sigma-70 family)